MPRASVSPPAIPPGGSPADKRHFGASTDDAAIFLEDTMDRPTAQCISASPSAVAILSPQRAPSGGEHVDITEYDAAHIGGSTSSALHDSGHLSSAAVRLNFGKSPTPKMNRVHGSASVSRSAQRLASLSASRRPLSHSAARPSGVAFTPASKSASGMETPGQPPIMEPVVSLGEYERLERERNRYQKMYEHQKVLYEEMSEKHADTYQKLQDRIVEVVALSTRNEESKRFIRQLKKEMSESRTRVMNMQNRVLEDQRTDRLDRGRYEEMLEEQDRKYERMVGRHETKMAGLESLVKDLTCINDERGAIHVSQLDALLRASYSKSTALFSDLLRQGRQIDYFYDSKADLDLQIDQLRKEKREMEASIAEERRHMMYQTERFVEQIEEQQQSILSLRQMLIRTMECVDDEDADMGSFGSRSSSFHSMSDEEEYAAEDVDTEFVNAARTARGGDETVSGPLISNAVVRPSSGGATRTEATKGAHKSPSTSTPSGTGTGTGTERERRSPTFLAERERNRPLLSTLVRQGSQQHEEGDNTAAESLPASTHSRRSHGRPSSGSAKSAASFIAAAGTRRSSTGSATKKEPKDPKEPTESPRTSTGGSGRPSEVSMMRRSSDGLFAAPAERSAHDDGEGRLSTSQTRTSAKKLDFSTALAAVAEIRERTRQARVSVERPDEEPEADKENAKAPRRPHTAGGTLPTVKRTTAIKEVPKSKLRGSRQDADADDDDDTVPRLTPHSRSQANAQGGLGSSSAALRRASTTSSGSTPAGAVTADEK